MIVVAPREMVLASAGSGKTFHISSKLIGLLALGEEPDRILAATFTRKAAGQILDRVLLRLARASVDEAKAVELSGHALPSELRSAGTSEFWAGILKRCVERLHRFSVGTLDAFFVRSLGAFALELGLQPGWRIADVPAARRMRSRALDGVLQGVDRAEMVELLRLAAGGDLPRSVHEHLSEIMEQVLEIQEQIELLGPDPWSVFGMAGTPPGGPPISRVDLIEALLSLDLPRTATGTPRRSWTRAIEAIALAVSLDDWESVATATLCQRAAADAPVFDRVPIDGTTQQVLDLVLDAAREAMRPTLAGQVMALGRLARALQERHRSLQRSEALYSFTDITRLIGQGDPVGSRVDLYYRLDAHTQHLLLDEFQDTSLPQWEALEPIVDEVLSQEGRAAVIVADPKQSIYGWRGAEPEIVHAIAERYELSQSTMAASWRSSSVVLDFVNLIFGRIAENPVLAENATSRSVAEEWARNFAMHSPVHDLPGRVTLETGPWAEGYAPQRQVICRYTAERVAALHREHAGFSIGVLTRTNAVVARVYLELRRLGVEVSQEGGTPLTDSGACEAILALLRFADHPGDTIARYHVASSPVGPVVGLLDYRDPESAEIIARRFRARLIGDGYGPTITRIARRIISLCDRREARRLAQLAELAHRYDNGATLRPMDFVRLAESERVEDRASAKVRVMTVHQAKGLEFDIVVLPQLDDSIFGGGREVPALPHRSRRGGRITAIFPSVPREMRYLFPEIEGAHQEQKGGVLRDGLSTLYVATTRPRYALHCIVHPDGESGPGTAITPARILREALRDPFGDLPSGAATTLIYESGSADWHLEPGAEPEFPLSAEHPPLATFAFPLPLAGRRSRNLKRETPSQLSVGAIDVRDLLRIDNTEAKSRGVVVHAWFEKIEWVEDDPIPEADLIDIARRIGPDLSDDQTRQLMANFRSWLANPAIRAALSRARYPHGAVVEREISFMRRHGDALMEGTIDRLVLTREKGRIIGAEILDFKTDRAPGSADRLASLVAHYRPQIEAYVDAVCEMYELSRESCRASLILLRSGKVVPVVP